MANIDAMADQSHQITQNYFKELEAMQEDEINEDDLDRKFSSYTRDRDLLIMKEKNPETVQNEFEDYIQNLLRTDLIIRSSFRKDTYFKIHSFQWKSKQIHTYNLVNGELETVYIKTNFNIPLFSRSIAVENGDIYLTGGLLKPYYLKTTFFFDEVMNTFVKKADMNLPRADHSLIYLSGYIYAIGSYVHNKCNNTCERYSIYK
jgi:hypothetical protein